MGFTLLRISQTIHFITLSLRVFPVLVQLLLYRKQVMDVVTLLNELEYYAEEDTDNSGSFYLNKTKYIAGGMILCFVCVTVSGRTWFYSLCITVHLETGYTIIPFRKCEKFHQVEGEMMISIRDPEAQRRYYIVMWLWYLYLLFFSLIHETDETKLFCSKVHLKKQIILFTDLLRLFVPNILLVY